MWREQLSERGVLGPRPGDFNIQRIQHRRLKRNAGEAGRRPQECGVSKATWRKNEQQSTQWPAQEGRAQSRTCIIVVSPAVPKWRQHLASKTGKRILEGILSSSIRFSYLPHSLPCISWPQTCHVVKSSYKKGWDTNLVGEWQNAQLRIWILLLKKGEWIQGPIKPMDYCLFVLTHLCSSYRKGCMFVFSTHLHSLSALPFWLICVVLSVSSPTLSFSHVLWSSHHILKYSAFAFLFFYILFYFLSF